MAGTYQISLAVSDGELVSDAAVVSVVASNGAVDITNMTFVNRSVSCVDYLGSFSSNVKDEQRNLDFAGHVTMTENADSCVIESNAIPNHNFNDNSATFANGVSEVNILYRIPQQPQVAPSATQLSLGTTNAILLNGVEVDMLAAACYNQGPEPLGQEKVGCHDNSHPWRYDPMAASNQFGTDRHNAHPQPSGLYHYHGNPVALFEQDCALATHPSAVIGFAADGYPVFGSCIKDANSGEIRTVTASYALKNNGGQRQTQGNYLTPTAGNGTVVSDNYDGQFRGDWQYVAGSGDLDECNGMTVDGQYGYYVTNTFPWMMNCFKGYVDPSFTLGAQSSAFQAKMHRH
ncbi:hypothetical protein C2869_18005 [Saccharobesus litoralis]|uniref:YHYH domain-containing protein n=2 Tax=Saccharobesus litoralis TaxID=2172099 RepID=A0A2S0VY10_9ALTE|nr:hypothetical protein C2869_18005 [Saccharobesus litoralis]